MTFEPQGPCKDCDRRTATCHTECKEYAEFKKELAAWKQEVRERKAQSLTPRAKKRKRDFIEWQENHKGRSRYR